MVIESNPNSVLSRSRRGVAPTPGEPALLLRRHSALSRLQSLLTDATKAPKPLLQIRWERRWTAASGAWVAVLLALLLGGIDWRTAVMVAATTFMLARGGDMLDNSDPELPLIAICSSPISMGSRWPPKTASISISAASIWVGSHCSADLIQTNEKFRVFVAVFLLVFADGHRSRQDIP